MLPADGGTKAVCLYPLPDGRRCLECATCHPTPEEAVAAGGYDAAYDADARGVADQTAEPVAWIVDHPEPELAPYAVESRVVMEEIAAKPGVVVTPLYEHPAPVGVHATVASSCKPVEDPAAEAEPLPADLTLADADKHAVKLRSWEPRGTVAVNTAIAGRPDATRAVLQPYQVREMRDWLIRLLDEHDGLLTRRAPVVGQAVTDERFEELLDIGMAELDGELYAARKHCSGEPETFDMRETVAYALRAALAAAAPARDTETEEDTRLRDWLAVTYTALADGYADVAQRYVELALAGEEVPEGMPGPSLEDAHRAAAALTTERDRLRSALEFYTDEDAWHRMLAGQGGPLAKAGPTVAHDALAALDVASSAPTDGPEAGR